MNVARTRRRLIQARRYTNRQFIPGQAPLPCWAAQPGDYDSRSALRAVARLARRKYRTSIADTMRMIGDDGSDCGGWTWDPPCGGCGRCQQAMAAYYADHWRRYAAEADCRLRRLV